MTVLCKSSVLAHKRHFFILCVYKFFSGLKQHQRLTAKLSHKYLESPSAAFYSLLLQTRSGP